MFSIIWVTIKIKMSNSNGRKEKNSVWKIIILLILMIGCFTSGYFINDILKAETNNEKIQDKEETKDEQLEEKESIGTNYEITDDRFANLIDNLLKGARNYSLCESLEIFVNDKKVETKYISNLVAYHIVEINEFYQKKDSFTLDEMNSAIKKYFDKDYMFNPNNIDYNSQSCPQYNYDNNTKIFNKQQAACGGTCGPTTSYKLEKAVDTDGILELSIKVVFVSTNEGKDGYYSDYQKTNQIGILFNDNIDSLYSKDSNYKFTFKLEDGNYVYVSSEPVV